MTDAPSNPYFAEVAEQWDEIRSVYFAEHMRDAAIAKANLPFNSIVADVGTGTGFVAARPAATKPVSSALMPARICWPWRGAIWRSSITWNSAKRGAINSPYRARCSMGCSPTCICTTRLIRWRRSRKWREQMADLWLGFERDDIRRWFAEAGLHDIDVDCAEGTCDACGPDGEVKPLSIFVAIGRK
jgi:hypothetical protein